MMVTLIKLLVINIVASVRSLSSRSVFMLLSLEYFIALISDMSEGERLKNAISDPLANAEAPKRHIVSSMAIITPIVGGIV